MFENKCKECKAAIKKGNKFCSSSCAAKYNNRFRVRKEKPICLNCSKELSNRVKKYCNNKCQGEFEFKTQILPKYKEGKIEQRSTLRKILNLERGSKCSICNIGEWNSKKLVFEVDHIDGNAYNNNPINLRLVCPNCHSQTEFYKGANRGNGRKARLVKSI